jgi:hypothetical protein
MPVFRIAELKKRAAVESNRASTPVWGAIQITTRDGRLKVVESHDEARPSGEALFSNL